jgi:fructose-1,6-bisphosphatase/inositol monophosphatase family enzyme
VIPDLGRVAALIAEAAAAEIMPRFAKLGAGDIREKAPGDLVTVADEAMERRLDPLLLALTPGALMVGEEATHANPALLEQVGDADWAWVIDPIDGTANFADSQPTFGVIVALLRRGDPVAAWIHDPIARETVTAAAGEGAWLGGQRLQVAPAPERERDLSGVLLAGYYGSKEVGRLVQKNRGKVKPLKSVRSAAHEYLRLARAEMHFLLSTKLMPWDHAAGVLIHREAGGHSGYLEGGDYAAGRIDASGLLLAPDPESWEALRRLLLAAGD